MSKWITDDERERIETFAELPAYMRTPEMLMPESDSDAEAGDEDVR